MKMPKQGERIRFKVVRGGETSWHTGRLIHRSELRADVFQSECGRWFGTALVFDWHPL